LTKDYEDKSLDADIRLDWQKRTVKFENSVKLWNKRYLRDLFLVALFLGLLVFGLFSFSSYMASIEREEYQKNPDAWKPNFQVLSFNDLVSLSVGVFAFVFVGAPLYDYVFSHPKFRGTLLKIKTKTHPYVCAVENPSGTLTFDLHRSNPLVDLEFPLSVSENLESASMIKVKVGKHTSRKQMVIKMKAPAKGTLFMKEY
jgi:hypothetical protein